MPVKHASMSFRRPLERHLPPDRRDTRRDENWIYRIFKLSSLLDIHHRRDVEGKRSTFWLKEIQSRIFLTWALWRKLFKCVVLWEYRKISNLWIYMDFFGGGVSTLFQSLYMNSYLSWDYFTSPTAQSSQKLPRISLGPFTIPKTAWVSPRENVCCVREL